MTANKVQNSDAVADHLQAAIRYCCRSARLVAALKTIFADQSGNHLAIGTFEGGQCAPWSWSLPCTKGNDVPVRDRITVLIKLQPAIMLRPYIRETQLGLAYRLPQARSDSLQVHAHG